MSVIEVERVKEWIAEEGYAPLTKDQETLLDVMCQFKESGTSPIAAALNVVVNHADKIQKQQDTIEDMKDLLLEVRDAIREGVLVDGDESD